MVKTIDLDNLDESRTDNEQSSDDELEIKPPKPEKEKIYKQRKERRKEAKEAAKKEKEVKFDNSTLTDPQESLSNTGVNMGGGGSILDSIINYVAPKTPNRDP